MWEIICGRFAARTSSSAMKTSRGWTGVVLLAVVLTAPLRSQEFSRTLTAEEFAAAGLDRLTPAQLSQLDALVRARNSGEIERVRAATETQVRAATEARVRAEEAAAQPAASPGLLQRMRVVLSPGTEIEYEALETQLTGGFRGYEPGKVLTLANGQRWRVVEGSFWAPARDADKPRRVVIEPGALGSFFLDIEDGGRPKVKFVGNVK